MKNNENFFITDTRIKKRGILYLIKKWFKILPFETAIRTKDSLYNVKIKISQKQMEKMVDLICQNAIDSM